MNGHYLLSRTSLHIRLYLKLTSTLLILLLSGLTLNVYGKENEMNERDYRQFRDSSIRSLHRIGDRYFRTQQFDSASRILTIAISRDNGRLPMEDASMLAEAHNMLGVINFSNSNYAGAYSHFLRAIKLYDVPDAPGYSNLAAIYQYYGDVPRAYECLKQSYVAAIERGHIFHAGISLINILTLDMDKTMVPVDSVRSLIKLFKEVPPEQREKRAYPVADAMADAYLLSHSDHHADAARRLKQLLGNLGRMLLPARDIHSVYTLIAREYSYANVPDSALAYLDKAQYIAGVNDFKELLASTYKEKSVLLAEYGRKEEAEHFRIKMLELNDSLFNPRELGKIRDIQMAYEADAFEKKLEVMKVKEHMWKVIIIIVSVALAILAFMVVLLYRKNLAIREKNKMLFNNQAKAVEKSAMNMATDVHVVESDIPEDEVSGQDVKIPDSEITDPEDNAGSDETKRKYTSSALTDETRKPILAKINEVFEDESLFCQENFSLQTLAQLCNTNQRYVSQIINETMGQNFASLLNEKRIQVACRRLMNTGEYGHLTIEAIVSDLGFKSRSTFSKTFKRLTGLTPGEFQRMAKEK